MKNKVSGNARVGVQAGSVTGPITVRDGDVVQVNGFTRNAAGSWTKGDVSVGIPQTNPCGCHGAESYTVTARGRQCVRCGKEY